MALVDLVMPKMGESITEATILKWFKNPGETVKMDEAVLEIATDKVDSEVPSVAEGVIEETFFKVNDVVPVGTVLARIRSNAAEPATTNTPVVTSPAVEIAVNRAVPDEVYHQPVATDSFTHQPAAQNGARFYSPLVLNIATSEGVPFSELENIPGSGTDGRVTKKDILQYVANKKAGKPGISTAHTVTATPVHKQEDTTPTILPQVRQVEPQPQQHIQSYSGNVEIVELDRMRKMISEHMIRSQDTSAHVTSFTECDVTNLVHWRDKVKKQFEKQEGEKLTFTPLFIEAIIRCIKKYPWLNSSVDGDKLIVKKDINIGMAAALPTGNLIVPVIRNADQLNLVGLTRQVNSLANAARNNKLKPDDTQGGTFTITNVGTFGSLMGTPIINQPQVAILATGAIKKRPVVIETEQGDFIAIRNMMYLSLSYDHRVIDGALGSTFLGAVAKELENFSADRTI
ncbi:diapophytoene dehydrogenase [Niastella koreensis]|uniref:Dihydrolipoamide acetyltransferase component of pyruvate dehydrogenase complex n=2 Tax=Niastella koreensis TaxID=354356 RepID=G8TI59_NIAKG|nr:dihydrolipoamide acetyltransferase family protein [Niastella koreensis]AEW00676.1 Dihydrolipoyllysine-residue succinyltransferase [Niastella koreensis GR20-10]OQP42307.1 diapophytoene dehydrogenase [Niastella koreensis]